MQLAILITGLIAAVLFLLSGLSFIFKWGYFRIFALSFLLSAIIMFILIIIRNVKEEWKIGGYRKAD